MLLLYAVVIIAMLVFFFWLVIQRKKNTEAMRKNIISKLSSDIELSAKDVVHIGKGFDLTSHRARQVIYKIYSDASSKDEFSKLKKLVTEIETEEPFDDLPDEVKPSMVRLTKITEKTGEESDKYLLSPIAQTLNKYVELKCDQEKLKKQTNRAYLVTVISFIFGSVGAYFSITAPSASDIAEEMRKQNEVINESKT
jgi:preprotein translocase subunit YajC